MTMLWHIDHNFERDRATVRLDSVVNQQSILGLCDVIDVCIEYYHYQDITIQIDSPGGEVNYLDLFAQKLEAWRRSRRCLVVRTRAFSQAASAAASILTLGDQRVAFESSNILFYSARVVAGSTPLTAGTAEKISHDIKTIDRRSVSIQTARAISATIHGRAENLA